MQGKAVFKQHTCKICQRAIPKSQIYCRKCYNFYKSEKLVPDYIDGKRIPCTLHQKE